MSETRAVRRAQKRAENKQKKRIAKKRFQSGVKYVPAEDKELGVSDMERYLTQIYGHSPSIEEKKAAIDARTGGIEGISKRKKTY